MRIACKLPARTCDCRHIVRVYVDACTRVGATRYKFARVHGYPDVRVSCVQICMYTSARAAFGLHTCVEVQRYRDALRHYATVTRRVKFAWISPIRARRKFICRVYTCISIVSA